MGTTLTGTTPQDTYDSLIKVTDNGPLSGSLKVLTDGLGNNSALSLSTGAASITGTLAVTSSVQVDNELVLTTNNAAFRLYRTTGTNYFDWSSGQDLAISTVTTAGGSGRAEAMRITSAGNVGIGTSAPDTLVTLGTTARTDNTAGIKIFRGGGTASYATYGFSGNAVINSVGGDLVIQRESTEISRFTTAGLCFNGDFAAANALDDYEEGTWTMGISFGGASVGVTYSVSTGSYTKIGRQVTVNGYLQLTSKGSSTGAAKFTGLPFTIGNFNENYSVPALRYTDVTFLNQFQAEGAVGTTTIDLNEITTLGASGSLTNADFANNSSIIISFTYFV